MARRRTKLAVTMALAFGTAAFVASRAGLVPHRRGGSSAGRDRPQPLRVVVVGAGFGGLEAAKPLAGQPGIELTLIDAQNHHLFQPLLYQVATAALSPADIAAPVRTVLPTSDHVHTLMATVTGVDTARREVQCGHARVPYDRLVLATGSTTSYFGHGEWAAVAPGLKTLEDSLQLRNGIISAFERAVVTDDPDARRRLLTFVLIGGGPSGVEMAGAIGQFVQDRLRPDYGIAPGQVRTILVEAGPRVLSEFAEDLSVRGDRDLRGLGVEVRTGTRVTGIEPGRVRLGDETIEAETVVWTAGMTATPVAGWLGVEPGHGGRVEVGADLRVPGHGEVFVIGDVSLARDPQGRPLPGVAPVAKQQGSHVAETILRDHLGEAAPAPFRYRDYGILATIGRNKAVAQFGALHLGGLPAWLLWAGAHIAFLISFRSRVVVGVEWAFAYVTHHRSAGLVIGAPAGGPGRDNQPLG